MDTIMDKILEEDYRYKLFIYQIFLIYGNNPIELGILTENLYLSQFKVLHYLDELSGELQYLNTESRIIRENGQIYRGEGFSQVDYQRLRREYFQQSTEANLLVQVGIIEKFTVIEYARDRFISKGTAYSIVRKINAFLGHWNLSLKKNKLVGTEVGIRGFCFQLFLYFFGMEPPNYLGFNDIGYQEMINAIQLIFHQSFSINQILQLRLILTIQNFRVMNENLIESYMFGKKEANFQPLFTKFYQTKNSELTKTDLANEGAYVQNFLILNNFIDNNGFIEIKHTETCETFYATVDAQIPQLKKNISPALQEEIKKICFKWEFFSFSLASFISKDQFSYFQQSFPNIHHLVHSFVEKVGAKKIDGLREFEQTHLYYDFMFCLLQDDKILEWESPIHIYVDFSGGEFYNRFIEMSIYSYKYLNLKIDTKLTSQTDIYISDFYSEQVRCKQIIWKNPPLDHDWRIFADTVIQLKGIKYK